MTAQETWIVGPKQYKETYKDHEIVIIQDDNPRSPREDDNLGFMACFHNNYILGDEEIRFRPQDFTGWSDMESHIEKKLDAICLPVYAYIHSGTTIATTPFSCPWNSGQVGFIYAERSKVRKEMGWKRITKKREEQILGYLDSEVKEMDMYLQGEIYGYVIPTQEDDGENLDSCFGIYGAEEALRMAKSSLDHMCS